MSLLSLTEAAMWGGEVAERSPLKDAALDGERDGCSPIRWGAMPGKLVGKAGDRKPEAAGTKMVGCSPIW